MSVDRILQLKLVTDVGDISRKMGQVDQSVGRVRGAFRGLRGFAGPVVIDAVLTGLGMAADALQTGMADVRAYDDAVFGLGQRLRGSLSPDEVGAIAEKLTAVGTALGFGDDAALVRGLEDATGRLGDVNKGLTAVGLAMDVARVKGIPFESALQAVLKAGDGSAKAMKQLGIEGETAGERWADIEDTFGGAAEDFAATEQGIRQVAEAMGGDVWETAGKAANDAIDSLLPTFVAMWTDLQPMLLQLGEQAGPVFDKIATAVQAVLDVLAALVPHVQAAWDIIEPFAVMLGEFVIAQLENLSGILSAVGQLLRGDFAGAWESIKDVVRGVINSILGMWNALDFSVDWDFDGPGIPNPLGGWVVEPIRISIHTGDIIPDVPLLAAGGIVTRPTLAMIGEAGPEAVVPLGSGGMGGNTYHIHLGLTTDPASAGRAVVEAIQAYERRAGARWRAA